MHPLAAAPDATLELIPAYLALTVMVPMIVAAVVTLICSFIFVLAVGFGIRERWMYSVLVFVVTAGLLAATQAAWKWLARRRRAPVLLSLGGVASRDLPVPMVGGKAKMLSRLGDAGVHVPLSWVLTSRGFQRFARANKIQDLPAGDGAIADKVRGGRVPRRLLKSVHRLLESSSASGFVVRSSFAEEDSAERAFPGVFESAIWERKQGIRGLEQTLQEVWSSYWSPRAVAYRGDAGGLTTGKCNLPILICSKVDHEISGFASSAEVATGFRERHLVEGVKNDGSGWTRRHDVLTGRVQHLGGDDEDPEATSGWVATASDLAGLAENMTGMPMEVEWGVQDGEFWAYQARPLTSLKEISTLTNSYVVELPRRPLTPLSRWFLFGGESPARVFNRVLGQLGLPALGDDDITLYQGAPWLRIESFKRYLSGTDRFGFSPRVALRILAAGARACFGPGSPSELPPIPEPPREEDPQRLLQGLRDLRKKKLVPLVEHEMFVLQLAAAADAMVQAAWPEGQAPAPSVASHVAAAAWYQTDNDAELSHMRRCETEADAASGALPAEPPAARTGSHGPYRRLVLRIRDGLLQKREHLKQDIAVTNFRARLHAEALAKQIGGETGGGGPDDVYFLTMEELEAHLLGSLDAAQLASRVHVARSAYQEWCAGDLPAILHLDANGAPVQAETAVSDGCLAAGVPLGNGSTTGVAHILHHGDAVDAERMAGQIVILPDPDIQWEPLVRGAAAVVFARGGPLSHLAILCRELGIPAVAAADVGSALSDGDRVVVDGDRGEVRPGH